MFSTNGPQLWPVSEHAPVSPPMMRREIGRPRKMRNKTNDKSRNPYIMPRRFANVTCKKYGQVGHNKRSCKGKRVADRIIPKGDNTKKAKQGGKGKKKISENQAEIA